MAIVNINNVSIQHRGFSNGLGTKQTLIFDSGFAPSNPKFIHMYHTLNTNRYYKSR